MRRILNMPGINDLLRQRARDTVAKAVPMAAAKLVELMQQPDSKKVSFEASQRILDIEGIRPAAGPGSRVSVNVGVGFAGVVLNNREDREAFEQLKASGAIGGTVAGYVFDLSEPEPAKQATHEPEQVPAYE